MANRYSRVTNTGVESHFSQSVTGELAFSRMVSTPTHLTTFNAGDIVPIYCLEVLPHDTIEMSLDFVIRQTTARTPTMGSMNVDYYAFFVPNRVVNQSWKAVQGENYSGSWVAPEVSLVPLVSASFSSVTVRIPVGSVADYYGFPTQQLISRDLLSECHDLKFRGYVMIYNEFFRDQNYQPPIPMSTLNVYQGFLDSNTIVPLSSETSGSVPIAPSTVPDGSDGAGAIAHALYGSGNVGAGSSYGILSANSTGRFRAYNAPLKANKLHDYFTSVLPSPQKGVSVTIPMAGTAPVITGNGTVTDTGYGLRWHGRVGGSGSFTPGYHNLSVNIDGSGDGSNTTVGDISSSPNTTASFSPANLFAQLSSASSATIDDLRTAFAIQQVYEALAFGGSRYRETVKVLFALEVDDPFDDIPTCLGHFRRELDLYQTAQTSATNTDSPQGNLAAFGYTANSGYLFKRTFLEHGYIHVMAVVRHKNVYSTFIARDNFRLNFLDWYLPQLANISLQPVYTREINPYVSNQGQVFGYQEAWAEYRYDPDYVSGLMRPGAVDSNGNSDLSLWNYADPFNASISIATGDWIKSNSELVLNRSLFLDSSKAPQLRGQFRFRIDKERPMPTYSIPGLDIF